MCKLLGARGGYHMLPEQKEAVLARLLEAYDVLDNK
jgi:hypothetical protein